jgi:hypothetical protein
LTASNLTSHYCVLLYQVSKAIPVTGLGGLLVKALCCRPEGHRFETQSGEFFSIYLIFPAALGSGIYSASNRNEYQKQKNNTPTYTNMKRTTSRHYTRRNEFITKVKIKVRNTYLRGNDIEFAIGL